MKRQKCALCGKSIRRGSGVSRGAGMIHAKCVVLLRTTQPPLVDYKALAAADKD